MKSEYLASSSGDLVVRLLMGLSFTTCLIACSRTRTPRVSSAHRTRSHTHTRTHTHAVQPYLVQGGDECGIVFECGLDDVAELDVYVKQRLYIFNRILFVHVHMPCVCVCVRVCVCVCACVCVLCRDRVEHVR
jgi:hypothetical protein